MKFCTYCLMCLLCLLVGGEVLAQPGVYDPQRVERLESRLKTEHNALSKAKLLLDLFDQLQRVQPEQAFRYNDQAIKIARKLEDKSPLAQAYYNKATQYVQVNALDKALPYLFKTVHVVELAKDPFIHAKGHQGYGVVYRQLGNYRLAIDHFYRSLELIQGKSSEWLELKCLVRYNLALALYDLNQEYKAKSLLLDNLRTLQYYDSPVREAQTLNGMALIYQKLEQYDSVLVYAQKAYQKSEPLNRPNISLIALGFIQDAYHGLKEVKRGLPYLKRAVFLADSIQNPISQSSMYGYYTRYFLDQQQLDSARLYADKMLKIGKQFQITHFHPDALLLYSKVMAALGKKKLALNYAQQYQAIKDSIYKVEIAEYSIQKNSSYTTIKTNEKLEKRYEQQLQLEREKRLRWVLICVFCILICAILWLLYQQNRKLNLNLLQQQHTILDQTQELSQLNAFKTQMFGSIAEDLRAPIAQIQRIIQELNPGMTQEQEEKLLHQLKVHSRSTSEVLKELIQSSRQYMMEED